MLLRGVPEVVFRERVRGLDFPDVFFRLVPSLVESLGKGSSTSGVDTISSFSFKGETGRVGGLAGRARGSH